MDNEIKLNQVTTEYDYLTFDTQTEFNQVYINDLVKLLKTHSTIPTHTPKKLLDCIYLYYDGDTTYELYLYISNTWKKVTLS